ncbi:hypothetical protein FIBSPDRAFT_967614 [Athelia psychrophila]|uniref:MARVEL domain-containing protein n=1 Tax=Athelia psychrophila TaxID=1759441 RepID=A0A167VIL5_9AGAM|nr:hypothetical protein FIBSPDRAFT_967614 [Fibularhizoctonia sp. CBS 109695]
MAIRLPTSLTAHANGDAEHSPVLRLSSLAISLGSIIACIFSMTVDGGNYIIIPPLIVFVWDLACIFAPERISPKYTGTLEVTCCFLPFAFFIVYMLIVFGNVGFGCTPGADPNWCRHMTEASASEGSATLLLLPLSLIHATLYIRELRAAQYRQGRNFFGTPL